MPPTKQDEYEGSRSVLKGREGLPFDGKIGVHSRSLAVTISFMISRAKSDELFAEALKYIPGGVNSPVRAFRAVGGQPFFVDRAKGARVWDVDGHEYIDYVCTWGPAILGHAHP